MTALRLGSLCTGYGGLDLGVAAVLDVEHVWHAEVCPDASKALAAHWPDVPNLGDLTAVDWASVEPVDVLTAGFPCQPVSSAGQRKGVDDERWLWDDITTAIGRMASRPRLLVLENVRGLLTANRGNAMARVVHGLAALGYVGRYRVVSAASVGAAHRRERVFIVAHLTDADGGGFGATVADLWARQPNADRRAAADTPRIGHRHAGTEGRRGIQAAAVAGDSGAGELRLMPTPAARLGDKWGLTSAETAHRRMYVEGRRNLEDAVALLPTPTAARYGNNQSPSAGAAVRPSLDSLAGMDRWGQYAPAIARWQQETGRPAPDPTEPGTKGQPRLAPRFVEWLMGLPAGHVTDLLPRNPALRVLGNGVVPQQAAHAVAGLLAGAR